MIYFLQIIYDVFSVSGQNVEKVGLNVEKTGQKGRDRTSHILVNCKYLSSGVVAGLRISVFDHFSTS